MCFRLILCTVLLVSVAIILSSSSSEHRLRRRSHSWKACEPFILPSNAEWIRRWYNRRCKGLFVCCEGYEMVVKTVCNKRGRWRVKTFCVPRRTRRKTTPTASTPTASTPTASTTTPTASSTPSSSTPSSSTPTPSSSTPSSTTSTTASTTSDPDIQCDANPMVDNGVITSDEISTEVGSVVQFNCSSGFTLNGRVGTLTCNDMGEFETDLICEDCRMDDFRVFSVEFDNNEFPVDDQAECDSRCNAEPDCIRFEFVDGICIFDFKLDEFTVELGSVEICRQACYDNSRCVAFTAPSADAQSLTRLCSLFTRETSSTFNPAGGDIYSTCI